MTPFDIDCPHIETHGFRCGAEAGSSCEGINAQGRWHPWAGFHEERIAAADKPLTVHLLEDLTQPAHRKVCILLLEGHNHESIAAHLDISYSTVANYVYDICRTLGFNTSREIATWMRETYYEPRVAR